jgi:hypothetical protein
VRRIIGTIAVALAPVAVMATSVAAANAQTAIEYALMSGFVASGNDGPEVETLDPAHRLGSRPALESGRKAGKPADPSGAFIYRKGRYTPLGTVPGQPMTGHLGLNNRGQIVGAYLPNMAAPTFRGFLRDKRGDYERIDVPGAASTFPFDGMGFAASAAFGIDNRGRVVGQYVDRDGVLHGYLWERKRGFRTIDPPGGGGDRGG